MLKYGRTRLTAKGQRIAYCSSTHFLGRSNLSSRKGGRRCPVCSYCFFCLHLHQFATQHASFLMHSCNPSIRAPTEAGLDSAARCSAVQVSYRRAGNWTRVSPLLCRHRGKDLHWHRNTFVPVEWIHPLTTPSLSYLRQSTHYSSCTQGFGGRCPGTWTGCFTNSTQ